MTTQTDRRIPETMHAAVYRTPGSLSVEEVPVPKVRDGEMLVRIHSCGVCGTDLKKIAYGLQPGPRIFGHEMAGVVSRVGQDVTAWAPGDRVALFHHVSCGACFYCDRGLDSQCPEYRKTATTAGFEAAGGGFARYVLATERAVRRGAIRLPDEVSFEEASFIEPLNTCLKGVRSAAARHGDTLLVFGLGSIGLLIAMLARLNGLQVIGIDPASDRRSAAERLAGIPTLDPALVGNRGPVRDLTAGRGADAAIVATPALSAISSAIEAIRPGGRVVLFANTRAPEEAGIDVGNLCTEDKALVGSYSSAMDLMQDAANLIFERTVPVRSLVTHRFPLSDIAKAIETATAQASGTLKVMVNP